MEMDWTYDDSRGPVAGRLPAVNWRRLPSGVGSRAGSEWRGQGVTDENALSGHRNALPICFEQCFTGEVALGHEPSMRRA
jgi:hypothetical protein